MSTKEKTAKLATITSEEGETYVVNYYITVNFMENCGVEKVVINQTGKPKSDDPPGTGG